MKAKELKEKIDQLLTSLVYDISKELSGTVESINLIGSYSLEKISNERPNVNLLIFTKANTPPDTYLKIGEIFYKNSLKYKRFFAVKIDSLPFRYGIPTTKNKTQLTLSPNILNMAEKNQRPFFGIPHNVLSGMKASRKVLFGSDPLASIDPTYSRKELFGWAMFDVGILFRNFLIRTPLSYNCKENLDSLAHDTLSLGKSALYWGVEIFMDEEEMKKGKHLELINNKKSMIDFFAKIDKKLGDAATIILEAREKFSDYVKEESKVKALYNASFEIINAVFLKVLSKKS